MVMSKARPVLVLVCGLVSLRVPKLVHSRYLLVRVPSCDGGQVEGGIIVL